MLESETSSFSIAESVVLQQLASADGSTAAAASRDACRAAATPRIDPNYNLQLYMSYVLSFFCI
jgi:hypothetical protein